MISIAMLAEAVCVIEPVFLSINKIHYLCVLSQPFAFTLIVLEFRIQLCRSVHNRGRQTFLPRLKYRIGPDS